jgi:hypothetical protein
VSASSQHNIPRRQWRGCILIYLGLVFICCLSLPRLFAPSFVNIFGVLASWLIDQSDPPLDRLINAVGLFMYASHVIWNKTNKQAEDRCNASAQNYA